MAITTNSTTTNLLVQASFSMKPLKEGRIRIARFAICKFIQTATDNPSLFLRTDTPPKRWPVHFLHSSSDFKTAFLERCSKESSNLGLGLGAGPSLFLRGPPTVVLAAGFCATDTPLKRWPVHILHSSSDFKTAFWKEFQRKVLI